jgi:hypothetical protein
MRFLCWGITLKLFPPHEVAGEGEDFSLAEVNQ